MHRELDSKSYEVLIERIGFHPAQKTFLVAPEHLARKKDILYQLSALHLEASRLSSQELYQIVVKLAVYPQLSCEDLAELLHAHVLTAEQMLRASIIDLYILTKMKRAIIDMRTPSEFLITQAPLDVLSFEEIDALIHKGLNYLHIIQWTEYHWRSLGILSHSILKSKAFFDWDRFSGLHLSTVEWQVLCRHTAKHLRHIDDFWLFVDHPFMQEAATRESVSSSSSAAAERSPWEPLLAHGILREKELNEMPHMTRCFMYAFQKALINEEISLEEVQKPIEIIPDFTRHDALALVHKCGLKPYIFVKLSARHWHVLRYLYQDIIAKETFPWEVFCTYPLHSRNFHQIIKALQKEPTLIALITLLEQLVRTHAASSSTGAIALPMIDPPVRTPEKSALKSALASKDKEKTPPKKVRFTLPEDLSESIDSVSITDEDSEESAFIPQAVPFPVQRSPHRVFLPSAVFQRRWDAGDMDSEPSASVSDTESSSDHERKKAPRD